MITTANFSIGRGLQSEATFAEMKEFVGTRSPEALALSSSVEVARCEWIDRALSFLDSCSRARLL